MRLIEVGEYNAVSPSPMPADGRDTARNDYRMARMKMLNDFRDRLIGYRRMMSDSEISHDNVFNDILVYPDTIFWARDGNCNLPRDFFNVLSNHHRSNYIEYGKYSKWMDIHNACNEHSLDNMTRMHSRVIPVEGTGTNILLTDRKDPKLVEQAMRNGIMMTSPRLLMYLFGYAKIMDITPYNALMRHYLSDDIYDKTIRDHAYRYKA